MTAWYLGIDAVGGVLKPIYLSGASTKGGKLMFGATWSIDAGDGTDDKCVFGTDNGEILIFTGSDPGDAANWRQEGRYHIGAPLGMNAHILLGGDIFILTVDGVVPLSQAITKDSGQLEQAMVSRPVKRMWREEVAAKRAHPWTVKKWDQYGGVFIATPGGKTPPMQHCLVLNNATGAWARFTWDATCFIEMRDDLFFGTMDGVVMQADRTGYDDGRPYVATLVGGWELFSSGGAQVVWHQARAVFEIGPREPFVVQLSATVDYDVLIPPPPPPGDDPGPAEGWDDGVWGPDMSFHNAPAWANNTAYAAGVLICDITRHTYWRAATNHTSAPTGTFAADREARPTLWTLEVPQPPTPRPTPPELDAYAQWDAAPPGPPTQRTTLWQSIGMSGFAHAPIVQITVAQTSRPSVELIAITTTQERGGVNV
jgi:hypothetical protein